MPANGRWDLSRRLKGYDAFLQEVRWKRSEEKMAVLDMASLLARSVPCLLQMSPTSNVLQDRVSNTRLDGFINKKNC
jgi:hypothetical protein